MPAPLRGSLRAALISESRPSEHDDVREEGAIVPLAAPLAPAFCSGMSVALGTAQDRASPWLLFYQRLGPGESPAP